MWNRFSIKIQLILFMTLVVSIVEISTLLVVLNIQNKDSKNNAILDADTISNSLNNDLLKAILNPNADMLADITNRLSAFKKIDGLILLDTQNNPIFKYGNTKEISLKQDIILDKKTIFTSDNLLTKNNLEAENYTFGYTIININLSSYKQRQEKITNTILLIFPFTLILGIIISIFVSKSYTRPFSRLLEAMKKSDPTKNRIIIVQTSAKNEIRELFDEFNMQMEQINNSAKEVQLLNEEIEDTQKEVVFTMGAIGESRSKETGNHVKRVAEYSKILALHYGLPEYFANMLKQASPMHDIGKVAIPDAVLNKPGRFDENERKIMDTHAQLGYEMLKNSHRPLLKLAATVAYEHHEKWNGTGYPQGLKGNKIDIAGRITAIADVFDALGSDRVYKKAWDDKRIFNLFKEEKGKHFDPKLIDIFFENLDDFLTIRDKFKDV
jgi:response regulator RpfG family c-di-GMP phosphodiesterase